MAKKSKATEGFVETPNIKATEGSQGTLFQGGRGQMKPEARYPRGYTPQRQAAVSKALHDTPITRHDSRGVKTEDHGTTAFVKDTIARSTVPPTHLRGLTRISVNPAIREGGTIGEYYPGRRDLYVSPGETHERVGDNTGHRLNAMSARKTRPMLHEDASMVLLHELGHHVDNRHTQATVQMAKSPGAPSAAIKFGTPENKGLSEGYADRYMLEHYRQDPRDVSKRGPLKVTTNTYHGRGISHTLPTYHAGLGLAPPTRKDSTPASPAPLQQQLFAPGPTGAGTRQFKENQARARRDIER